MSNDLPDEIKRWTAPRRATLVLQILRGETTANEAARHTLSVKRVGHVVTH